MTITHDISDRAATAVAQATQTFANFGLFLAGLVCATLVLYFWWRRRS